MTLEKKNERRLKKHSKNSNQRSKAAMFKFFFDEFAKLPAGQKFQTIEDMFKGMNAKDRTES